MKIVIHAGMPKTGSSSIQDHFFKNHYPRLTYARWKGPNHSPLYAILFEEVDKLSAYHGFKIRGPEFITKLPELRAQWQASLTEDLNKIGDTTLLFSAEAISGLTFHNSVGRMGAFFRQWTDDITVMAYVRRPLSFAASAFQQKLKGGGLSALDANRLWPEYRPRFSQLDEVFGRDRVILKPYDRQTLVGGDVVRDFAAFLGVEIAESPASEANIALSAEATALLFAQRHLGAGFVAGFPGAERANHVFVNALRRIGSRKLTFSDSLWNPIMEKNRADLDWIEERLGMPLRDGPNPDALAVSGEEDLLRLASESQDALEAVLIDHVRKTKSSPIEKTVSTLELLRKLSYQTHGPDNLGPSCKQANGTK